MRISSGKRRCIGVLAAACLLTAAAVPAVLPEGAVTMTVQAATYGDLTYTMGSNYVDISKCDAGAVTVEIPSEISGRVVRNIKKGAFSGCTNLKSVTIAEGAKAILDEAFSGCTALESVTIPSTTATIGMNAFSGCTSLLSVSLPEGVTSLGAGAFSGCTALKTVELPASLGSFSTEAVFGGCTGMESISIADGNAAYRSQDGVLFSSDGTTLVLYPKQKQTAVYQIPEGVEVLEAEVFRDCPALTSVEVPSSLKTVKEWALPETGALAVNIYADYVEISGCDMAVTQMSIPAELFGKPVRVLGNRAFYGCSKMSIVSIPETVQVIGDAAFAECSGLRSVIVPKSVVQIGDGAFRNCSGLMSMTLSEGLQSIGGRAFQGCSMLGGLALPATVQSIGNGAFMDCKNLRNLTVAEGNAAFQTQENVLLTADGKTLVCYPMGKTDAAYTVPEGVTTLAAYAFYNCGNLKTITTPSALQEIGSGAMENCTALTELVLPDSVTTMGDRVFANCIQLESIHLPQNLTQLGIGSFMYCISLDKIELPKKLSVIPFQTFYYCQKLSDITIPKSVQTVEESAFSYVSSEMTVRGYAGTIAENVVSRLQDASIDAVFVALEDTEPAFLLGDANGDGKISVEDAAVALQFYATVSAGGHAGIATEEFLAMDIDGNGAISVEDAVQILKYYAKQSAGLEPDWET